jgi:acyl transferase domain-containing protein/acyl carrier protein
VFGIAFGCLKSIVTTPSCLVAPIPESFTYEEAACLPIAATTVEYSFHLRRTALCSSNRVLVHAGTGGVGLFAIQMCIERYKLPPSQVFATAGNPIKTKYLQETYKLKTVASSRNPKEFKKTMEEALMENKLDIVINCLSGDFIKYSVDMLKDGGTFIEIGKRDIWTSAKMKEYRPDIHYDIIAIDNLIEKNPLWFQGQLYNLLNLINDKKLSPIPVSIFPMVTIDSSKFPLTESESIPKKEKVETTRIDCTEGFRYLQKAQHIGKVIIKVPSPFDCQNFNEIRNTHLSQAYREEELKKKSYLITGALGALGKIVTQWLLTQEGVQYLILCTRKRIEDTLPVVNTVVMGPNSYTAPLTETYTSSNCRKPYSVAILTEGDIHVAVVQIDVNDSEQMTHLLGNTLPFVCFPPVHGVFHLAGCLDDKSFVDETFETFKQPFKPKLQCSIVVRKAVHETKGSLDFFVGFSSIASRWGNFGQTAYGAANFCLDYLSYMSTSNFWNEKELGCRAKKELSINWGPWDSEGMASHLVETFKASGITSISEEVGMRCLHDLLVHPHESCLIGCSIINSWTTFLSRHGNSGTPCLFKELLEGDSMQHASSPGTVRADIVARLSVLSDEEISKYVFDTVNSTAMDMMKGYGKGSGTDSSENLPPLDLPLTDIGLDSLAAVELGNELGSRLGTQVPTTALFNYPTLRLLRDFLADHVINGVRKVAEKKNGEETNDGSTKKKMLKGYFQSSLNNSTEWDSLLLGTDAPIFNLSSSFSLLNGASFVKSSTVTDNTYGYAVVGMACCLPGEVGGVQAFWNTMMDGIDCVKKIPSWRFSILPEYFGKKEGEKYPNQAALVSLNPQLFDRNFFNMSQEETRWTDPQQLRMLELAYDAFYDSGLDVSTLAAQRIACFIGCCNFDWHTLGNDDMTLGNAYSGTGSSMALIANRISYVFKLTGPSLTIDTACSSALAALDTGLATLKEEKYVEGCVVGAINTILVPHPFVTFFKARMLAYDGRCKTFDQSADGYGRGEGGGVVYIQRLQDAEKCSNIRRIIAVIRSSCSNHDGSSASITAPNGLSQEKVLRGALEKANLIPDNVCLLECHGTGTPIGDPIEVAAVTAVYCADNTNRKHSFNNLVPLSSLSKTSPLFIGAVKTVIGHLEGASGIAGLIKLCLVLRHQKLPVNLHLKQLNKQINVSGYPTYFPTNSNPSVEEMNLYKGIQSLRPYRMSSGKPLIGGVSSFGFGGSNVHAIVEQYQGPRCCAPEKISSVISEKKGNKATISNFSPEPSAYIYDKLVFLFTGQGSHDPVKLATLYNTVPIFKKALKQCHDAMKSRYGDNFLNLIMSESSLDNDGIASLGIVATQYALFYLFVSEGIHPKFVLGHSLGEYMASVVAGFMSLEDALCLVDTRNKLIDKLPIKNDAMIAIRAKESDVISIFKSDPKINQLCDIAAVNGNNNLVLSGDNHAIDNVLTALKIPKDNTKQLVMAHAFHSPLLDPIVPSFSQYINSFSFQQNVQQNVVYISAVTGKQETCDNVCTSEYWVKHLRNTVRFLEAINESVALGGSIMVELGMKPTLIRLGSSCVPSTAKWFHVLGDSSTTQVKECLDALYKELNYSKSCDDVTFDYLTYSWNREFEAFPQQPKSLGSQLTQKLPTLLSENLQAFPQKNIVDRFLNVWKAHRTKSADATNDDTDKSYKSNIINEAKPLEISTHDVEFLRSDILVNVTFREALETEFGFQIPEQVFNNCNTFDTITEKLYNLALQSNVKNNSFTPTTPLIHESTESTKISIIGVGCDLPGGVTSPLLFWKKLESNQHCFTNIPMSRFNVNVIYSPYENFVNPSKQNKTGTYCRVGAFINDAHLFNHERFHFSTQDVMVMDPQHRLMLKVAYDAAIDASLIEHTTVLPQCNSALGNNIGVFVGFTDSQEWILVSQENSDLMHIGVPDNKALKMNAESQLLSAAPCLIANRISHVFGWSGPSMTLDTGCSSSTAAVSVALESLLAGTCSTAIVGGVSLLLTPITLIAFSANRRLTPSDRVHSFSKLSQGTLRGEGSVALVLTTSNSLTQSYGFIRSAVTSSSGRLQQMGVPSPVRQQELIQTAFQKAKCFTEWINYVETHGAGLAYSDAAEIAALKEVFKSSKSRSKKSVDSLVIGAIHPTMGHMNGALGVAQLLKAILSLSQKIAPPICGLTHLHSHIDLGDFACVFPTENTPIAQAPLTNSSFGLVNTFGVGGVSTSVVLQVSSQNTRSLLHDVKHSDNKQLHDPKYDFSWEPLSFDLYSKTFFSKTVEHPKCLLDRLYSEATSIISTQQSIATTTLSVSQKPETHTLFLVVSTNTSQVHLDGLQFEKRIQEAISLGSKCTVAFCSTSTSSWHTFEEKCEFIYNKNNKYCNTQNINTIHIQTNIGGNCGFKQIVYDEGTELLTQIVSSVTDIVISGFSKRYSDNETVSMGESFYSVLGEFLPCLAQLLKFKSCCTYGGVNLHILTHIEYLPEFSMAYETKNNCDTTHESKIPCFDKMSLIFPYKLFCFEWAQWILENFCLLFIPKAFSSENFIIKSFSHRCSPVSSNIYNEWLPLLSLILSTSAIPEGLLLDLVDDDDIAQRIV